MAMQTLYLIVFLDAVGMAFTLPLIAPHILSLGGSLFIGGLLHSLTAGAQFFSSPLIGSWSDTKGRKQLLLTTLSLTLLSNVLIGYTSLSIFFIGQILYGIVHQTEPLIKALIGDMLPVQEQTAIFNKLMACILSSFFIGPILGGILYEKFQTFVMISIILFFLNVVTISIVYLQIEEPIKSSKKEDANEAAAQGILKDFNKVITNLKNIEWVKYGDLLKIKFILEASFNMLYMNMGIILMEKYLFTRTQMGLAITYLSLSMMISTFVAKGIMKLYKSDASGSKIIFHGFLALLILFILMPFTQTWLMYLSLMLPLSMVKMTLDTKWMEMLSSKTTESDKGVMMGAANSMLSLAGLVCPLINGFIGDVMGVEALLLLPIFPAAIGTHVVNKIKSNLSTQEKNE